MAGRPVPLRPPQQVMRLDRMGAAFPTRLSFLRQLLRRMARERWRIAPALREWDDQGDGCAIYTVTTPQRTYSLLAFTHALPPDQRSDRVVAEAWDATFALYDGVPEVADLDRLAANVPRQEAGRCRATELVLSRANRSGRLFDQVVAALAAGRQPEREALQAVGYLMRTTAVYGNGKFGIADRDRIAGRPEFQAPFQAEMLCVYLIRGLTLDLVDHIAAARGGAAAVRLAPELRRALGIGNATGLGMAPFLVAHPTLIHNWVLARETALARARSVEAVTPDRRDRLDALLTRTRRNAEGWCVPDATQDARCARLRRDLADLAHWLGRSETWQGPRPLDRLMNRAEVDLSLEGQEATAALLIDQAGASVDDLADTMHAEEPAALDVTMPVGVVRSLLAQHYDWALAIDAGDPAATARFWYAAAEKAEPRLGDRRIAEGTVDPGTAWELPLAVARDVQALHAALEGLGDATPIGRLLLRQPSHRHTVRRVQTIARAPYGEIRDNLIAAACRPIDLLRFKLAFFGAERFDPKGDRWTRITLYRGAPLPDELARGQGPEDGLSVTALDGPVVALWDGPAAAVRGGQRAVPGPHAMAAAAVPVA